MYSDRSDWKENKLILNRENYGIQVNNIHKVKILNVRRKERLKI